MKIGSSIILCNGVHIDAYSSLPHIYSISCRYKKKTKRDLLLRKFINTSCMTHILAR